MKKINQVKIGMILSYLLIICNALYGFVITPYIVGRLGEAEYGVYKSIGALASSLLVLDIGLGSTVMRYLAKYKADKEEDKIPGFLGMGVIQAFCICALIAVVSIGIFFTIKPTYSATFTNEQIKKAQMLFAVYGVNIQLHVWSGFFAGIIKGHNHFAYANGMQLLHLLLRAGAIFALLQFKADSLVLVLADTCFSFAFICLYIVYIYRNSLLIC